MKRNITLILYGIIFLVLRGKNKSLIVRFKLAFLIRISEFFDHINFRHLQYSNSTLSPKPSATWMRY